MSRCAISIAMISTATRLATPALAGVMSAATASGSAPVSAMSRVNHAPTPSRAPTIQSTSPTPLTVSIDYSFDEMAQSVTNSARIVFVAMHQTGWYIALQQGDKALE
jgi:hypothetical protein